MSLGWIDIPSYAKKYGISTSTIRRRIRQQSIPFRMEKGRYLLPDSPQVMTQAPLYARAPQESAHAHSPQVISLEKENRRLKAQISELETLVKALEAELRSAPGSDSHAH